MVLSSAIVCDHDRRIADDRRPYCDLRSYGNQPLQTVASDSEQLSNSKLVYRNGSEYCLGEAGECCYDENKKGRLKELKMTHGAYVKRENAVMTRNVYNNGNVYLMTLIVQRKKKLQLYLFETVKYTINCSVILLNGETDF